MANFIIYCTRKTTKIETFTLISYTKNSSNAYFIFDRFLIRNQSINPYDIFICKRKRKRNKNLVFKFKIL